MATYQDTKGTYFNTQAEAAASNTALGTNPAIPAANLTPVRGFTIPPPDTSITTGNLGVANNTSTSGIKTDSTYEPPEIEDPGKSKLKSMAESLFGNIQNQAADEAKVAEEAKLQEKKQKALSVSTELDVLDKQFRDEIKAIKENPEGKFGGAIQQDVNKAQDRYEDRRANISLAYKVALQDYQGAEEIVNAKVASIEKQNQQSLQAFNSFKDLVYNDLTESEKVTMDEQSRIRTDKAKLITDTYSTILANAVQNNAPASVLSAIDEAARQPNATAATIATAAGKYGVNAIDAAQLRNINSQIAERANDAKNALNTLPGPVQTRVQGIAGQFDAEQAVKNYQTSAEAIDALNTAGSSPTDDIGRVYAFAKVMDPNSVVREGEYKTVQDYSTALLERIGLKAKRVFDNVGFLTDEARTFMKTTLDNRLASSKKAYDNIYNSYGERINKVTGRTDGKDYITDYSAAFKPVSSAPVATEGDTKTWEGVIYKLIKGIWEPQ